MNGQGFPNHDMAQFLVKIADDRGRLAQHVESGYSESEVRERFVAAGLPGVLGEAAGVFLLAANFTWEGGRSNRGRSSFSTSSF